jgi:nucleotidyltransferase substrate binding protein (TIGR01987 family)
MIGDINIQSFLNARQRFEEFRNNLTTDQNKAGAIQAFEFTYESAWKIMKRLLEANDITISSSRECFREAAIFGMISDAKVWFDFIRLQSLTSHTYNENVVDDIIQQLPLFSDALNDFLLKIGCHE